MANIITTYPLPRHLKHAVLDGYLKAIDVIAFLIEEGWKKPLDKDMKDVCLLDLSKDGYRIVNARVDASTLELTLS